MTIASQSIHSVIPAWLKCREPLEIESGALVQAIEERQRPSGLSSGLANELREARFPPRLLQDYADVLGINATSKIVRGLIPSGSKIRRGYFGEVISACCLRDFEGCWIPVQKLRSMVSSDQSLPGIDVIGAHVVENRFEALVLVEAKVRTIRDRRVILSASQELLSSLEEKFPSVLHFTAVQLQQRNDPMYWPFLEYLKRRDQNDTQELPFVYLLYEKGAWSDQDLSQLDDLAPLPKGFKVSVIEIANLAQLIDSSYTLINVEVDDSDDE